MYKDAPRTYKRPKFNAFRNNNDRSHNDRSKSNKSKNDRSKGDKKRNRDGPKPNYRLMTFDGAKDLDANTIKVITEMDGTMQKSTNNVFTCYRISLARTKLHQLPFLEKVQVTLN